MYFFEKSNELNAKIQKIADCTNYDTNLIWSDVQAAIAEKYSLPAFHVSEDGYRQGDASDDEVFEAKDSINAIDGDDAPAVSAEWDVEDDTNIITDIYGYLDQKLLDQVKVEILKVIRTYWAQYYEEEIRDFLKDNFFSAGGEIGIDWSMFINVESGEIWEHVEASSNWSFMHDDENRKLVLHYNNHDTSFEDYTDLVSSETKESISSILGVELPESWDEMEYGEQCDWLKENAKEEVDEYDSRQRNEKVEELTDWIVKNYKDESFPNF